MAFNVEHFKARNFRQSKRKLSRDDALRQAQIFRDYQSARASEFDRRAQEAEELYRNDVEGTGTQYTRKQLVHMRKSRAPAVSMNNIQPTVAQARDLITQDRPTARILPVGDPDKVRAFSMERLWNGIWRNNRADALFTLAVEDVLVPGLGAIWAEPSTFYNPGIFNISLNYITWKDIYVDPTARMGILGFPDAERIILGKFVSKRKCKNMYGFVPEETGQYHKTQLVRRYYEIEGNEPVLIRDIYEKRWGIACLVVKYTDGGEQYVTRMVFKSENEMDQFHYSGKGAIVDARVGAYIHRMLIVGSDDVVFEHFLPMTRYPGAIYTGENGDTPFVNSMSHYLIEPQKALNKFYQTALLDAALAGGVRWIAPRGAYINKTKWQKYASTPGATLEFEPQHELKDGGMPQEIGGRNVNAAWFQLSEQMSQHIEKSSGVHGPLRGDPNQAPETFGATQDLITHGITRLKSLKRRFEYPTANLCMACMEMVQFYGQRDQVMTYFDDQDEQQQIALAQVLDDTRMLEIDVQVGTKTSFPTDRQAMVQVLQTVLSQVPDPEYQKVVFEKTLRYLDFPVSDELLKDFDSLKAMQGQLQQLATRNEYLEKLVHELAREVRVTGEKAAVARHEANLKVVEAKTQAKADTALGALEKGKSQNGQPQIMELA
jgi:hypothetical protein